MSVRTGLWKQGDTCLCGETLQVVLQVNGGNCCGTNPHEAWVEAYCPSGVRITPKHTKRFVVVNLQTQDEITEFLNTPMGGSR
jgi:hypothetical protein